MKKFERVIGPLEAIKAQLEYLQTQGGATDKEVSLFEEAIMILSKYEIAQPYLTSHIYKDNTFERI